MRGQIAPNIFAWDGDPTNAPISAFNPPKGAMIFDLTTPAIYEKTSAVGDNSGFLPITFSEEGRMLYVDSVNGVDATAARGSGKAFLTPEAAKAAAVSGDTIIVRPGAYSISANLFKNGVNWHFEAGATVTWRNAPDGSVMFGDAGVAVSCSITGRGNFVMSSIADTGSEVCYIFKVSHASSRIYASFETLLMEQSTGDEQASDTSRVISVSGGYLSVVGHYIYAPGANNIGVEWTGGTLYVNAQEIDVYETALSLIPGGSAAINAFVDADLITGQQVIEIAGANANAAAWIRAAYILTQGNYALNQGGSPKIYLATQKITGPVMMGGTGLLYVDTNKHTAYDASGSGGTLLLLQSGGTLRYRALHGDPDSLAGDKISITGGTATVRDIEMIGAATTNGVNISGGTLRLVSARISTAANSAGNPVTKSGGTLILENCTLLSHASADSIAAGTAQNVKVYGTSVANKAKHANVTLQVGTLTVDTDVA